ncbi:MAG: hypothetical protein NZ578_03065 [Candidatus Binatia bacterium]|nr:hypothetical protein [Candidatus Binatia bacterium]
MSPLVRRIPFLLLCSAACCWAMISLALLSCFSQPPPSKTLVTISNVKVWRENDDVLALTFDYDLAPGVTLPLPYKEVLVFPLEPQVNIGGTLEPFVLSVGSVAVRLHLPADAGIDWEALNDQQTCCSVSLKGLIDDPSTQHPRYERISNEVRIPPPQRSG